MVNQISFLISSYKYNYLCIEKCNCGSKKTPKYDTYSITKLFILRNIPDSENLLQLFIYPITINFVFDASNFN